MSHARDTLDAAIARTGSALSIGLEPDPAYLPHGFDPTPAGYEAFFRLLVDAAGDLAAAFKVNLAFFEALGNDGWPLLERTRAIVPDAALFIADGKRGDIGSTAERSARALYDRLGADAATVNPLMGRDAVEPFLERSDRLTYCLALTSNPGAADFLLEGRLAERIARAAAEWDGGRRCAGLVVGATRGEDARAVRAAAPNLPMLVPGVGAQGGDLARTVGVAAIEPDPDRSAAAAPPTTLARRGLLFHVTRGVLPAEDDPPGDAAATVRAKAERFRDRVARALAPTADPDTSQTEGADA